LSLSGDCCSGAYIFHGWDATQPLTPRSANYLFNKWKRASAIRPRLTIHSFRSGFATYLYAKTNDALLVSKETGHSNISTTSRYIHLSSGDARVSNGGLRRLDGAPLF
jgi:integrase